MFSVLEKFLIFYSNLKSSTQVKTMIYLHDVMKTWESLFYKAGISMGIYSSM